ncbi:MAG: hypothetical protein D3922_11670 [Candidatus Electrothrix sp. AR1]|nr:hypothetical protein [Candidatus Electrothrix sp. AR1]
MQSLVANPYKKNTFSPLTFPVLFLLFPAVVFHRCKLCENREIFPALVGRTQEVFLSRPASCPVSICPDPPCFQLVSAKNLFLFVY